jgi:polyisoprenoid-binding protein YceI
MNRLFSKMLLFAIAMASFSSLSSQKYFTKQGNIEFISDAAVEKIEGINSKATSVIDTETGKIQWAVLIKAFKFEKALMEEHFNENYMESSKFPKAQFKGLINNMSEIDLTKDGTYEVQVSGQLTIHGITKDIENTATFSVAEGKIVGTTELKVLLPDYEIKVPSVVRDNISDEIEVKIEANYELFEK